MDTAATSHRITTVVNPEDSGPMLDEIRPLYAEVYAEAPYHEDDEDIAHFVDRYDREHQTPGFRLVVSRDELGGVSGFAYGLPLSEGTAWWKGIMTTSLSTQFTRENGHRTFVVMELAIRAPYRRRGLARSLHAALIPDNSAERFALAVRPEAEPATALYASLGYELVGLSQPWTDAPVYRSMIWSPTTN